MKFLAKREDSAILERELIYKDGGDNSQLKRLLLEEQKNFCAYTEKRVDGLDSTDVEHFDATKKHTAADDYHNYYAVLHSANQRKRNKERKHAGARFFATRFFQRPGEFKRRIRYVVEDHVYEEVDLGDTEAKDFIDYLGFNDALLVKERRKHIERVHAILDELRYDAAQRREWLANYPEVLSFITGLELVLGLALDDLI